jgi:hypothetical protein
MKVLSFAIFAQLLDMITTMYGSSIGLVERNVYLGTHPTMALIVGVKLLLIAMILCLYVIIQPYNRIKWWSFNVPIAIVSVWTLAIAMVNLSQEIL